MWLLNTPIRRLDRITYWVIEDPDGIWDFINNEVQKEWIEDARSEGRDPLDDLWLKTLSKRRWSLEVVCVDEIELDPRIMNSVNVESGQAFMDALAKRSQEFRETIERFASVIWPVIVKSENFMLVDGYCRYNTLKAMNISRIYAYVGRSQLGCWLRLNSRGSLK